MYGSHPASGLWRAPSILSLRALRSSAMLAKAWPISPRPMATRRSATWPPRWLCDDAKGLHILPGVIDSQVHFREPGLEQKKRLGKREQGGCARRCHCRVRDARIPSRPRRRRRPWPTRSRAHYCDFAFFVGATKHNIDTSCPRSSGSKALRVLRRASTVPVDDEVAVAHSCQDQTPRRLPFRERGCRSARA